MKGVSCAAVDEAQEIRRRRIAGFDHQVALKARASEAMAASVFCLVPAGDTFATSRLYSAVATGCLPVLLGDGIEGALKFGAYERVKAPLAALLVRLGAGGSALWLGTVVASSCSWMRRPSLVRLGRAALLRLLYARRSCA